MFKVKKNSLFLAPMAGITDTVFRLICKEMGADMVYTEFVSANGIIRENKKTLNMMQFKDIERPLGIQIFGDSASVLGKSAKIIRERFSPDIIDINFGCPVKKVVNGYAGSALMKDEILATKILESVSNSVKVPVTLKMRKGWDDNSLNAPKIAKIAENSGIKMITIHGRTRCQMYKGKSDWKFVKNVKSNVKIPVLVNGDITNKENLKQALKDSKADGVMIGRGSYGRPWIFEELCSNKKKIKINNNLKKQIILNHLQLSLDHYGKDIGLKSFRKHLGWYSKSINNSNEFRLRINQCTDEIILKNLINDFF